MGRVALDPAEYIILINILDYLGIVISVSQSLCSPNEDSGMGQKQVAQGSRGDVAAKSKFLQGKQSQGQGLVLTAIEGFSAIYGLAAKFALEGLESLADRRAEKRAERLTRAPAARAATSKGPRRPLDAQRVSAPNSAPKRAPKSA
jgi:hypothetical protein